MKSYKVVKPEGVEINGAHYSEGYVFNFEGAAPDHVRPFVEDDSLIEVENYQSKKETTMSEDTNEQVPAQEEQSSETAPATETTETTENTDQSSTGNGEQAAE